MSANHGNNGVGAVVNDDATTRGGVGESDQEEDMEGDDIVSGLSGDEEDEDECVEQRREDALIGGEEASSCDEDEEEEGDDDDEEEEDSSDMDVQECDRKRYEFIDDLTDLEKQFAVLREQLYRERITQIEAKLEEVRNGKAAEYLQPLEELQFNMKSRLEVGAVLKELQLQNIQCKYEAELLANEQNFQSEKDLLWDSIKEDLEEKIHILEEDKNNVDFSTSLWDVPNFGSLKPKHRRKADPTDPDRRKKPVTIVGPYIAYMLDEQDIIDDWAVIKKALTTQRRKPDIMT